MRTLYFDSISHTGNVNVGSAGCRTLLRVPRGLPCKSNLRVTNLKFAVTNPAGLTFWQDAAGFLACITEIHIRDAQGHEVDSLRWLQNLLTVKNAVGKNSFQRDIQKYQIGSAIGMNLEPCTGLQQLLNENENQSVEQGEYTINLSDLFDYLRKVQFIRDGLEIEIIWGNNPLSDVVLSLPNNPVLAIDEVPESMAKMPERVLFNQIWSDIVTVTESESTGIQQYSQRLLAIENYFCVKLAVVVVTNDNKTPVLQYDQILNFLNNGNLVVQQKGLEMTNAISTLSDIFGDAELTFNHNNFLNVYNSEANGSSSMNFNNQLQNTNQPPPNLNAMGLMFQNRAANLQIQYQRLTDTTVEASCQQLNLYVYYWIVREADHTDAMGTVVKYA